jgi:uncharacterized protein YyaL (SSP411 family)
MRFLLGLCVLALVGSVDGADPVKGKKTNRLAKESSPYLLHHAHNPVDWYPWGEEAFARAKKENKLIFLSIGYSSCHWCHVMERESFENEEVAKILNEQFVCIKVDREERPDVDNVYMTALHVQNRRGGWPLSMFLTPEGKPVVGGTYWPREDKEIDGTKIRGFKTILNTINEAWKDKEEGEKLRKHADRVAEATSEALAGGPFRAVVGKLDRMLVDATVEALKEEHDPVHGGFGNAGKIWAGPKFPMPAYVRFLQHEAARTGAKDLKEIVERTLDHMARGGIYDHLGGGFHRYTVERTWTVPHFEKMLYDNAQLCEVYARAYRETKNPLWERVLRQTLGFISRELTSPEGAYYSALDADSEEEEGKFYVWTRKEINSILEKDANLFLRAYGVEDGPNFEEKYSILLFKKPLAEIAKAEKLNEQQLEEKLSCLRPKLLEVRAKRPRPFLDTKVLTAWNGQMIAGAALAGQALDDKKVIEGAAKAATFILEKMRTKEGRLLRTYGAPPGQKAEARLNGYLDDYAYLVHGLLTLHDVTGEKRWLDEAKALTDVMVRWHEDKDAGGFFYVSSDHEKLFARSKDQFDGAEPSGNSVAARNLVRLWQKTGDEKYEKQAEKTLKALAPALKLSPANLTTLAEALSLYLEAKEKKK